MDRALALSRQHGLGCVALANTNHWMRGGSYGWQAVEAGAIGICWTNTMANLPAWGAPDPRVGNNPLVIAVPHADGPVVLDMAMSQFSFGALESYRLRGEAAACRWRLRWRGQPDPRSRGHRGLGAGAAHRLLEGLGPGDDARHAGGAALGRPGHAPDPGRRHPRVAPDARCSWRSICAPSTPPATGTLWFEASWTASAGPRTAERLRTPGERIARIRRENLEHGIPVDDGIWQIISEM